MTSTIDPRTMPLPITPPGGPPGPIPPSGAPPSPRPRRPWGVRLGAGVAALAVAAGVATTLEGLDGSDEVQYQTVSSASANPFTSPVGADRPGMTSIGGGERPADTPQMYAADPDRPACDAAALLGALQVDPARAAVWAQVQRTTPARLPAFVEGLTPVVLRADTAVVDHGFRDGADAPTPAVLAAGTAVFVNSYGQPTVKCFSGNPLTPGASSDPAVTTVTPTAAPIATHTFHHPATGRPVTRPGKPDTTGGGPVPMDGGSGTPDPGTPDPSTPDPGSPDPVTQGPAEPPITGTFNPDGSITLSDGRIQRADGTIVTLPPLPAGSVPLPDGGYRESTGEYRNRDGSPRDYLPLERGGSPAIYLAPDGTLLDGSGQPLGREAEYMTVVRSHDGAVTVITDDPTGEDTVVWVNRGGRVENIVTGTFENGVITDASGRVRNPDGSERREATLPGGGKILPNGTNVPPPGPETPSGHPGTGGAGTPTTTTRIDPPVEPREARGGGVVDAGTDTDTGVATEEGSDVPSEDGSGQAGDGSGG